MAPEVWFPLHQGTSRRDRRTPLATGAMAGRTKILLLRGDIGVGIFLLLPFRGL